MNPDDWSEEDIYKDKLALARKRVKLTEEATLAAIKDKDIAQLELVKLLGECKHRWGAVTDTWDDNVDRRRWSHTCVVCGSVESTTKYNQQILQTPIFE